VRTYNPGDKLTLEVERDSQVVKLEASLTSSIPGMRPDREDFQNHLGTDLSQRRFGFPTVFQHDTVVKPVDCGGPVVNLDGQVVGFNIARAGRTETYAIGTPALAKLMYEMMSGSMKPEAVVAE
jgi:serine protease Do